MDVLNIMMSALVQEAELEWVIIDLTIVRVHSQVVGAPKKKWARILWGLRRSRGGLTTKIHVVIDALGLSVCLIATLG